MTSGQNTLTHVCCIVFNEICRIKYIQNFTLKNKSNMPETVCGSKVTPNIYTVLWPSAGQPIATLHQRVYKACYVQFVFKVPVAALYVFWSFPRPLFYHLSVFVAVLDLLFYTCPPDIHSEVLVDF